MSNAQSRIVIIGAGVAGLSIGWRLAQRGAAVTLFERHEAGQGASHAAAGMLAACAEVEPGEEKLFALNRASQALWPQFAAELERASGHDDRPASRRHAGRRADRGRPRPPAARPRVPAAARAVAGMAFRRRDAAARAASVAQPRRGGVQPAGSSGRQPQGRRGAARRGRARGRGHPRACAGRPHRGRARPRHRRGDRRRTASRRYRGAGRGRLVAFDRRPAVAGAPAGPAGQGPDAGAAHGRRARRCCATWSGRRTSIWCRATTDGCSSARPWRREASTRI